MKRTFALPALISLTSALAAAEPDPFLRFLFDGFPAEVRGRAGEKVSIGGFSAIYTTAADIDASWCQVMTADGGTIFDVALKDVLIGTSPVDKNHFANYGPVNGVGAATHKDDPTRLGAISAVWAVGYPRTTVLLVPEVSNHTAFLTLEVEMPPPGVAREVVLRYEDKFCFPQSPPAQNIVTSHGKSVFPAEMLPWTIVLRGVETPYRRADADASGAVDLGDAVFVLEFLFQGGERPPCDRAADANADDKVNLSDPVFTLNHLFRGGPAPPLPFVECDLDESWGDRPSLHCASFPPCR